jgi:hypothetical protein
MHEHDVDANNQSQVGFLAISNEPVKLLFNMDGIDIDPVLSWLETGRAGFECSATHFDMFYEGKIIGPAVLALHDQGMVVVDPVVKSKNFPMIEVEFLEVSATDRRLITSFLATENGGQRPAIKPHTVASGYNS